MWTTVEIISFHSLHFFFLHYSQLSGSNFICSRARTKHTFVFPYIFLIDAFIGIRFNILVAGCCLLVRQSLMYRIWLDDDRRCTSTRYTERIIQKLPSSKRTICTKYRECSRHTQLRNWIIYPNCRFLFDFIYVSPQHRPHTAVWS